ncbi:hypothetical protein TNIN_235541 [Trichonephila inaurata madagascariensis]|uniref:Uncharacterized protein n=1 Tax=Trichonephila inaurata madagascariensis TaxID=2747483 RepID=A0A8X6M9D6_9ARAC|nr:hypothetical protein TNIN_104451 [Trichonephila inaurata madagascariensis]GFY72790.1 hypothetical protein TNIN_235541 [Trichonephila inaurata madagascariensis]
MGTRGGTQAKRERGKSKYQTGRRNGPSVKCQQAKHARSIGKRARETGQMRKLQISNGETQTSQTCNVNSQACNGNRPSMQWKQVKHEMRTDQT